MICMKIRKTASTCLVPVTAWSLLTLFALASIAAPAFAGKQARTISIGVLAHRPKPEVIDRWQATADHLSKRIPGYAFVIVPFTYGETDEVLKRGDIGFVITNPSHYVQLSQKIGLTRVATLIEQERGYEMPAFGGAILVAGERSDVKTLQDLKNRTIAAPDAKSLGGYQVQAAALLDAGVSLPGDARLLFTDMPHDRAIRAVLDGKADAAFVRTGVLEGMISAGTVSAGRLRALNQQPQQKFPFVLSTALYPEWPFAVMPGVDEALAKRVTIELLSMASDNPAVIAGKYHGWDIPADYESVRLLLEKLHLPPYDRPADFSLGDIYRKHRIAMWFSAVMLGLLVLLLVKLRWSNQQLEVLHNKLQARVAEEVSLRKKNEDILVQQSKLAAMGEMLGAIAHQWRQPLNALGLIIQNIRDAYDHGELDRGRIERSVQKSMSQIQHMSKTIDDFRHFFQPDKERADFDTMYAVGEVLALFSAQLEAGDIAFSLVCSTHNKTFTRVEDIEACPEKTINGFRNEFEHVILNLINNAREAIVDHRVLSGNKQHHGLITFTFRSDGDSIVIEVGDNGGGVPAGVIDRIFEPYFTTKDPAKGTGLGLYMSKVIIEEHMGGTLSVRNSSQGALFTIGLHKTGTRRAS